MARDYQRKRVYDWENWLAPRTEEFDQNPTLTLEEIADFSRPMLSYYRIRKRPKIKDGRGARSAAAYGHSAMRFPRSMRKNWIVAHEVAHIIKHYHFHDMPDAKALSAHGPVFAGIYTVLLHKFLGVDPQWLRDTARVGRVKVIVVRPSEINYYRRRYSNG